MTLISKKPKNPTSTPTQMSNGVRPTASTPAPPTRKVGIEMRRK
jgi:hypothetical protein